MKKIILSAFITTAMIGATFAEAPSPAFNGVYLGAGLNYTNEKIKEDNDTFSIKGGGAKLFGGYGAIVSQGLYLGGELALGYDQIIKSGSNKIKKSGDKLNYSIAARLGYAISSALPYLKVGYEGRPSFKIGEKSIKRSGVILGGGVDVAVSRCVFVRGEYVHGFGSKSKIDGITIKSSSDTFMLGAAYKF